MRHADFLSGISFEDSIIFLKISLLGYVGIYSASLDAFPDFVFPTVTKILDFCFYSALNVWVTNLYNAAPFIIF